MDTDFPSQGDESPTGRSHLSEDFLSAIAIVISTRDLFAKVATAPYGMVTFTRPNCFAETLIGVGERHVSVKVPFGFSVEESRTPFCCQGAPVNAGVNSTPKSMSSAACCRVNVKVR